jgi:two-component system, NtrC family, response regulator HydG
MPARATLAEKRRILQLETLYDLALALQAHRTEEELVEELLERVCAVLDPQAAVAATRDAQGGLGALASVGWAEDAPLAPALLADSLWRDVALAPGSLQRRQGDLAGRPFRELLAASLTHRGHVFGLVALLDKETRSDGDPSFSEEDARFLESVAALAGVALEGARQVELLEEQRLRLEEENRALRGQWEEGAEGERIIAHASAMRQALERARRVAPRGVTVLVRGESGTGKELIARLLHLQSGRSGPLVAINCGALPESLLESELFGIEGGVATGVRARRGKIEVAHQGTLFLDEIGDLAPPLQVKLLRVLQEREIVRVGGQVPVPVDVRVVAATHRNLEVLVREGTFREDLYYRLRGVEIELPPLRARREDIPHLVRHFARDFCRQEGIPEPPFDREALALLLAHDYPGNVRELQNLVEAAISLADGRVDAGVVRPLMEASAAGQPPEAQEGLDLETVERRHIERVLEASGGNKSEAARILGIDRRTLLRKGF